ncbi:hypothetical protein HFN01_33795 [Rhizobium leguminosarum]|uniref:hypothetical protein n=1 Tax=Rhizobium leguminosarum TaxID=384 RepID=UPI001C974F91|nr:hypothetical protein [Rhizobium leguminosarum]MBY5399769.1 hypothetical protein [Rhizobium leguminosarum]
MSNDGNEPDNTKNFHLKNTPVDAAGDGVRLIGRDNVIIEGGYIKSGGIGIFSGPDSGAIPAGPSAPEEPAIPEVAPIQKPHPVLEEDPAQRFERARIWMGENLRLVIIGGLGTVVGGIVLAFLKLGQG